MQNGKIYNKVFITLVKDLLKEEASNPELIWRGIESPQNAYYLSISIFQILINSDKKSMMMARNQALLSTLLILEFYFKNTKPKGEKLIRETKKILEENWLYGHGVWVFDLFLDQSTDVIFGQQFFNRLVNAPKQLNLNEDTSSQFKAQFNNAQELHRMANKTASSKEYKCLEYSSYEPKIHQTTILTYSYVCFTDYMKSISLNLSKASYRHIITLLKALISAMEKQTYTINRMYMMIVHAIKTIIRLYGCSYPEILKEIVYLAHLASSFPGQLGQMAHQLFGILHQELKTPATAFRKSLLYDFPFLNNKHAKETSRNVYLVSNHPHHFSNTETNSVTALRKLIIYNILASCQMTGIDGYWKTIRSLNPSGTFNIYFKLMKMVELSHKLDNYEKISKLQKDSILQLFNQIDKEMVEDFEGEHEILTNSQHPLKIFQYPLFQIIPVKPQQLANRRSEYSLEQMIEALNTQKMPQSNDISLAFMGEDFQFSRFLTSMSQLINGLSVSELNKLNFYLIPVKNTTNGLAEYLANKDFWYSRFVYHAFHDHILYPDVDIEDHKEDLFPYHLFSKCLHSYLREATQVTYVQLYKCKLKLATLSREEEVFCLTHVLMGCSADFELMKLQKAKKKSQKYDYFDFLTEKYKRTTELSIELKLSIKKEDSNQSVMKSKNLYNLQDFQLCNIPRHYFMGNKPNPSSEWLQLSLITEANAKVLRKELPNRSNYKKVHENQIHNLFQDLFTNLSINRITISTLGKNTSFQLFIDGAIYNKVENIIIEPVMNANKELIRVPIRCFTPYHTH